MGTRTGNPTWQDSPSTATLITAARLNALESAVDASLAVATPVSVSGTPTSGQVITATSGTAASWQSPVGGTVDTVSLTRTGAQSISTSTTTNVLWDNEVEDAGGFHDLVTNTDRLTVPSGKAGLYLIAFNGAFASNTTGLRSAILAKNGSTLVDVAVNAAGAGSSRTSNMVVYTLRLAVADYVTAAVWQNSGGTLGTDSSMYLTMTRLGA